MDSMKVYILCLQSYSNGDWIYERVFSTEAGAMAYAKDFVDKFEVYDGYGVWKSEWKEDSGYKYRWIILEDILGG